MKSHYLKKHVCVKLNGEEGYFKAFVEKVTLEMDMPSYHLRFEDDSKEIVFASSVFRIWLQQSAKILRFKKKKLSLVK